MTINSIVYSLLITTIYLQVVAQSKMGEITLSQPSNKKAAIIIANQNYHRDSYDLQKTANDADDMRIILEKMGFEIVIFQKDATRTELDKILRRLEERLKGYGTVFFYYSGHGAEFNGENFFIPTDIEILEDNRDIRTYGISLNTVYEVLQIARVSTQLIVTDACRTLPLGKGYNSQGLILPKEAPLGTYTMFATRSGRIAKENIKGRNSYFTQELLKYIGQPNLRIDQIFRQTKVAVSKATNGEQEPVALDELEGELVLLNSPKPTVRLDNQTFIEAKSLQNQKNYKESLELFQRLALEGNSDAENELGAIYEQGIGLEKNYELAYKWYKASAEHSNPKGLYNLGSMYANGRFVSMDYSKAIKLFEKSAEQGEPEGQNWLGGMYLRGDGVLKNENIAFEWFSKSAKSGNSNALYRIGSFYEKGIGVSKNIQKAHENYNLAAQQQNDKAYVALGKLYQKGQGVSVDLSKSYSFFKKAAELNNSTGQAQAGFLLLTGKGTPKDIKKGLILLNKASQQDDPLGWYYLGYYWEKIAILDQDLNKALWNYRKASQKGMIEGYKSFVRLKNMSPIQVGSSIESIGCCWDTLQIDPYRKQIMILEDTLQVQLYNPSKQRFWNLPCANVQTILNTNFERTGVAIATEVGDPIYSTFDGIVRIIDTRHPLFGKSVLIRHYNGLETIYSNLSEIIVTRSQVVKAGDMIGLAGYHPTLKVSFLFFECLLMGKFISPYLLFDFKNNSVTEETVTIPTDILFKN